MLVCFPVSMASSAFLSVSLLAWCNLLKICGHLHEAILRLRYVSQQSTFHLNIIKRQVAFRNFILHSIERNKIILENDILFIFVLYHDFKRVFVR